jgi:hypothetical protein
MTKRIRLPWAVLARLLRSWGDKVVLATALVATAIGFSWLDSRVNRAGGRLEPDDRPGSGVNVRAEVLHVWLPQSLIDVARSRAGSAIAHAQEDSRTTLEDPAQKNLWYALATRGIQANGAAAHITFIRRPYSEPQYFPEFLEVLAFAAGYPKCDSTSRYFGAELHILTGEIPEPEECITLPNRSIH